MTALRPPPLVSSRPVAHELLADAPEDLTDQALVVHFGEAVAVAPSFVDELVRVSLVERSAQALQLVDVPERTASYAERSARAHDVDERLTIQRRIS